MDIKPTRTRDDTGGARLSSVATAIALLKAFSEDEVEIGISLLAKRLGVAKSTAHRLATTLVSEGLLEQDRATGKYRLGIALFRLGTLVRRRMNVSEEARPHLFSLREKTNETVHLAILDGADIMYVYFLESTQAIRMRSDLGGRKPAYCTAEGQAILAFSPAEVVQSATPARARHGPPEGLRHRGRGERDRRALHRGADPQRYRRGGGGRRRRRPGEPAVEEGAHRFHAACDRNRRSYFGPAGAWEVM